MLKTEELTGAIVDATWRVVAALDRDSAIQAEHSQAALSFDSKQRVAKERHEVTPAPRGAQSVAEEEEVGQCVLEEEWVCAVAADVHLLGRRRPCAGSVRAGISAADLVCRSRPDLGSHLDSEPQIVEASRRVQEGPQPVEHGLHLHLVESVDEGHEVELRELRVALEDVAERRPARLRNVHAAQPRAAHLHPGPGATRAP